MGMCGPTGQQKQISQAQQDMYSTLNTNYGTAFGQQQGLLNALTSTFQPILQAGPFQAGYSPGQLTALNTSGSEKVAQNYAQAQQATARILAAQGGGNNLLPSSVNANLLAANTNQAAAQRAGILNQNTLASYQQGYQNWQNAAGVLGNVASTLNPNAYAGQATGAGQAAATTANQIAQASMSPWTAAIGALGSLGGAALGNVGGIAGMFGSGAQQVLAQPNQLITGYNAVQNMAPPPLYAGGMPNPVPTFAA